MTAKWWIKCYDPVDDEYYQLPATEEDALSVQSMGATVSQRPFPKLKVHWGPETYPRAPTTPAG